MIWFTSDQHFDHANVIKYDSRPFPDLWHMNEGLIERFNARVAPGDKTYHLGDFSMNARAVGRYLPRLNGTHVLVPGNHDVVHPMHKIKPQAHALYAGFEVAGHTDAIEIGCHVVNLCHIPYVWKDRPKDYNGRNFDEWALPDDGRWLLHGHVHTHWKKRGHMINVGVCQWDYAPVSIDEIKAYIAEGEADE